MNIVMVIAGAAIIITFFGFLFWSTVREIGWRESIIVAAATVGSTALICLGVYLLVSGLNL